MQRGAPHKGRAGDSNRCAPFLGSAAAATMAAHSLRTDRDVEAPDVSHIDSTTEESADLKRAPRQIRLVPRPYSLPGRLAQENVERLLK